VSISFKTTKLHTLLAAASLGLLGFGAAHAQSLPTTGVRAVPTYEAAGLYWSAPGASSAGCDVRYRVAGSATWSNGLALWFDSASNECRGSIVYLTPGTPYEVQLGVNGSFTRGVNFTTWANTVPMRAT